MEIVKSINYSQEEIIKDIIKLYLPEGIECDATYSKGVFYKNIEEPKLKFDLVPQKEGVIQADCRNLPLKDSSLNSIMFDPPFLISGKGFNNTKEGSCIISKRFSAFETWQELKNLYKDSLVEFSRLLKDKGILIFKCQDTISSGKQHLSHVYIINEAIKAGFYPKDLFVLMAKSKITSFGGRWKTQRHAMKYHSYFLILQKINRKINYEV